ncbi:MAG: hypothetical protein K0R84_271 [Clostridia bacterium]|nr:hypothetical protein [Clostridia bacterium]
MRHSLAKKIICGVLACGMMMTSSAMVFGDVDSSVDKNMRSATLVMKISNAPVCGHRHEALKDVVNKLVEEGKLTREKADKIIKYAEEKEQTKGEDKQKPREYKKFHLIENLQKDGIINDIEAETIRSKFREVRDQIFNEKLNRMVQEGTINQAQADKIKVYFENDRKEKLEKLKNMTDEQRQAYFKERKRGQGVIDKLVNDGVITKEQARELKIVLQGGQKGHSR